MHNTEISSDAENYICSHTYTFSMRVWVIIITFALRLFLSLYFSPII